ncbi:CoA activase [Methylomonas sp. LWB]|uniref:acyl-CoA dehydratase activase n=1 Tax=Methylomonas sp. LWB TaxID=1905845 RepID=UPI0008DA30C3|nr:acyl-CoA dehydratase activase [Methylomonas sp. LWB]OHX36372.1 CoA activase [Methylomonas sp. LWB]
MNFFAGIDIGSTAIKVALVDEEGQLTGVHVTDSGSLFHKNAKKALQGLLDQVGVEAGQVKYLIASGYGRKLFKEADDSISEITANAIGAHEVGKAFGGVRTIINIGGQDSKAIQIDDTGNVSNFVMNDKCAAGTGRFLDVAARNLEIDLEELGEYHMNCTKVPLDINSTCTVFAESEIIGLLANGHGKEEIIAGIHYSIAKRTVRLAKRVGLEDRVYFDGGPALNKGLVSAIQDLLGRELVVPDYPQTTTAFGAAILARREFMAEQD